MRTLAAAMLIVLLASPALAQQSAQQPGQQPVKIERAPGEREPRPEVVAPGLHYQQTRPSEADYYWDGPRVQHDPAFIEPFTREYQAGDTTGRIGLSGWTSPNTPVGPVVGGYRDITGWLSIGFSITWGGPPPGPARQPPVR
jgi:hypothetical protein